MSARNEEFVVVDGPRAFVLPRATVYMLPVWALQPFVLRLASKLLKSVCERVVLATVRRECRSIELVFVA